MIDADPVVDSAECSGIGKALDLISKSDGYTR
jgi:hypothetical protein